MVAVLLYVLIFVSDSMLGDPLGGPVFSPAPFEKVAFGQTVGQLASSIADTNIHVVLGLFAIASFALGLDPDHTRQHFVRRIVPLCLFAFSSILAVFFAIKFKAGLLWQVQFDRVNVDLLRQALMWHLISLLLACLSCFSLVLLSLSAKRHSPERMP